MEHEQIRHDFDEYHVLPEGVRFDEYVTLASDPYAAAEGAHALAVMTEWDEFAAYDYARMFKSMEKPAFVFDGRGILDHAALQRLGFNVYAIGKPLGTVVHDMN